jgi:hypothetical protein
MTLSYFQNWKTKTLILIIILFITHHSFSQEKTEINDKIPVYENSLKGFVFAFPIYGASVSLGYERTITKHSTIELGTYYRFFLDEMGLKYHRICIMPAYKYYTVSENKFLNDFWLSVYLSYLFETHKHPESNIRHSLYYYGFGVSIGKRINLHKSHRTFLNIGFGVSYNYYDDKPIFSNNDWSNMLLYRPIIQIGRKF